MIVLTFVVTNEVIKTLQFMRAASAFFKLLIILQVIIAINICFVNALLAAAQKTGINMLMSSLGMLFLNDLDNIVARLFYVIIRTSLES